MLPAPQNAATAPDALADVEVERAKAYGRAAKCPRTRHEYARAWAHFADWCAERGVSAIPASAPVVARYLASLADDLKISSIRRRVVAISQQHQETRLRFADHPQARARGGRRDRPHPRLDAEAEERPERGAAGCGAANARFANAAGQRDRAILLFGCAGALCRSELAALNVDDLAFDGHGLTVTIPRSKTDQVGVGRQIGVPYVRSAGMCAVTALRQWLGVTGIGEGAVFRTFGLPRGRRDREQRLQAQRIDGRDLARIVQRAMAAVDGDFAAHSLRAGFVTSAAQKKIPQVDIMRVTGQRSVAVLRGYVRRATLFEDAPLSTIVG